MHRKTIIFAIGVLLGITIGYRSLFASEFAVLVLVLLLLQIGIYFLQRKRNAMGVALSLYTTLFCCGLFVGIVRVQFVQDKDIFICEQTCTFSATVSSSPKVKDAYQTFTVVPHLDREVALVQVRTSLYPSYRIGETIAITGKVALPDFLFPHERKKQFDYESYLRTQGVGSQSLFPSIQVIDKELHTIPALLGAVKEDAIIGMSMYIPAPASALGSGMLFGNSSMSQELTELFRVAGLSHIVVLSGFNIAIIVSFILFVLFFLPLTVRILLTSLFVIIFVIMVGGEVSIIRATLMALLSLVAMAVGRAYAARQALILSLLGIVLYDPFSLLHSVSLHLSFLATAGIIYLTPHLDSLCRKIVSHSFLVSLCSTTLAAYVVTLPYSMYTFGTVSLYALIANAVVLPFVPLAMFLSFIVVVTSYFSHTLALTFGYVDSVVLHAIIAVAKMIDHLPFSSVHVSLSFAWMVLLYFICVTIFLLSQKNKNETFQTNDEGFLTDSFKY